MKNAFIIMPYGSEDEQLKTEYNLVFQLLIKGALEAVEKKVEKKSK